MSIDESSENIGEDLIILSTDNRFFSCIELKDSLTCHKG